MSLSYAPSFEESKALNFTCSSLEDYQHPCPSLFECWYDEDLGDTNNTATCHCGTIAMLSNEHWPDCSHPSGKTWLPRLMGAANVITFAFSVGWAFYIVFQLHKLKQLSFNDITQCLTFTSVSSFFGLIHQGSELIYMFSLTASSHKGHYGVGGVAQISLTCLGLFLVLADLKLPLLWLSIASSSMNKVDAERKKKRVGQIVKGCGIFFFFTFLAIVMVSGTSTAGMYSLFWILIIMVAFNVGSRKLRNQLAKPGEEPSKTVKDIMTYVRRFTCWEIAYIVCVTMFIMNTPDGGTNPSNWQIWASLIYFALAQVNLCNITYIRRTLDKKLAKFKKNGNKVIPTTVASSTSSTS